MFDAVVPVLHYKNANARSEAIFALVRIDASRARPMLLERLKEEKSPIIRKDIVIALESARTAPDQPPSPDSVVADAEFTMQHINAVTPPWLDEHPLPALRWTNGAPVPPVVGNYVLYAQSRSLDRWLEPRVAAMLPLIDRASVGDWSATAWRAWLAAGAPAKDAWIVALLGAWGDERLVVLMSTQITAWSKGARGAIAVRVVYGLALIPSDLALAAVDHLAATSSHAQVSAAAQKAFDTTAARLGHG